VDAVVQEHKLLGMKASRILLTLAFMQFQGFVPNDFLSSEQELRNAPL